jgi:methylenetetrahydrofolate--tRNA-(uracil-5-)-methyltransferase
MAARGVETLRFGPMKPVGLTDPRTGQRPHAVVQLRQDNALGTLYNMVGFQTKLKYGEQARVLRMIPGLEKAESPRLLDGMLRLKSAPRLRFAGQITGVEGYVESAAIGLLAGRFAAAERLGRLVVAPPPTTAHGALLTHITAGAAVDTFQPMNVNFGLFPPLAGKVRKKERKPAYSHRALADLTNWRREAEPAAA